MAKKDKALGQAGKFVKAMTGKGMKNVMGDGMLAAKKGKKGKKKVKKEKKVY